VIEAEEVAALSQVARQRSQTYWWLSELFLDAPDRARIAGIVRESRDAARPEADLPLKDHLDALVLALEQSDADALAVEHARLFSGLGASYGATPPYESMHVGNEPREDRVTNVTAAYREAGFERIDVPAVPQDHLAVELRFMALLAANESAAWDASAADQARAFLADGARLIYARGEDHNSDAPLDGAAPAIGLSRDVLAVVATGSKSG